MIWWLTIFTVFGPSAKSHILRPHILRPCCTLVWIPTWNLNLEWTLTDGLWRITQQVDLMINDLRSLQTHSLMMMFPVNNAVHTQAFSRNLRSYGGYLVNTSKWKMSFCLALIKSSMKRYSMIQPMLEVSALCMFISSILNETLSA